ncbi:MAG: 4-hydroxy-tetrahydrodipicolinate synthase [Candidatus Bathyarchaeia archaeon]|nr:4-hydroxy-tetrahydrodipicolinate synthase [Candidatus Bathyarchaeota archaeon]
MNNLGVEGVIPAMVTPFHRDGSIDLEGLRRLTRILLDAGVHGLFPLGSIGEGPKLSREERMKVLETVMEAAGSGVKVIPGAGGVTTRDTIQYVRDASDLGASAAIIHPPWYYHPTPDALLQHYLTVADSSDIPIILYNLPSFVGYEIPVELVVRAAEHDNIIGIKDSSANLLYFQELMRATPEGFNVIQGYGVLFLPSMVIGGRATLSGEANLAPGLFVGIYEAYLRGDLDEARRLHLRAAALAPVLGYGTFPASVKEAMNMMGLPGGYTLPPSSQLTPGERDKLRRALMEAGLLKSQRRSGASRTS